MNKFISYIKQDAFLIYISLLIGTIITIIITTLSYGYDYSNNTQENIAKQVIRFHVLANSNSDTDQELKLNVKNGIIDMLAQQLDSSTSTQQTRELLIDNLDNIQEKSLEIINNYGYNYSVDVKMSYDYFPTKIYGDVTLPAGTYECIKIEIGEAVGENWWCVMFPPLCFVDITMAQVPDKDKDLLKEILSEEEYKLIDTNIHSQDLEVKVKFKIIEFWQNLKS